jgi:hypothetical protein
MFGRKTKRQPASDGAGTVDGGEGRGVPLGGRDERPPTGYRSTDEEDIDVLDDAANPDLLWEDGDPADRRRDPLRK